MLKRKIKYIIIFLALSLSSKFSYAQKLEMNLNSINPMISNDIHGDTIRKYFSSTFYSENNPGFSKDILINAFYSNKLAVNYKTVFQKIPQLRRYPNTKETVVEMSQSYSSGYAIPIFDSTGIIITVNGINTENKHNYEFRVIDDNNQIVLPWTEPKLFTMSYWMTRIADPNKIDEVTAYLGQFKQEWGKSLTFEVRKKSTPEKLPVMLSAYWVKWQPRVIGTFTFSQLPDFLSIFKKQWNNDRMSKSNWSDDPGLKLRKAFHSDENNLIFYLDDIISSKKIIEYSLVKDGNSTPWMVNDFDFNLVWLKNLSPGNYVLKIRYSVQRENVTSYSFVVTAAWYQTIWAKTGLIILGLLAIGFLWLLWRSKQQAEKLRKQSTQKQVVQTELKSIRSQFNPHFVFNALSSIQGLITKNDPENASRYLVEFGNLMRDSLKASNNEFVSISKEIRILENYLNLEKLRFGFNYQIKTDDKIDTNAIEIPSLFLQPLVENAVKHGISALQEQGGLVVSFKKMENDMIVCVADNGKGFKENWQSDGFGLQLTAERIKLLNQTLNGQEIKLSFDRENDYTQITIQFKNWLI